MDWLYPCPRPPEGVLDLDSDTEDRQVLLMCLHHLRQMPGDNVQISDN